LAIEAAEPTPEELAQTNRAIELNEQDVVRKERLIESSDPAIIESGRQALQLLRGEEARTLDPIRRERQERRTRLEDRLRSQLGSGFATSTAGSDALNDFDQGTDSLLAQEQDRSLGRLLGVAERTTQQQGLAGSVGRGVALSDLLGAPRRRELAAITQTPTTQFAGAPFVQETLEARNRQQLFGNLVGGASTAATLGAILGGGSPGVGGTLGTQGPGAGGNIGPGRGILQGPRR